MSTPASKTPVASLSGSALIVDDEPDIRELIALSLDRIGLDTHTAANLAEARHLIETYAFDVCLTDMRLPDGNGLELVRHVQATRPTLPIAVITAHGNMEAAVEAMKDGAFDFVSKPVDLGRLRAIVTQAIEYRVGAVNESLPSISPQSGNPTLSSADATMASDTKCADSLESLSGQPSMDQSERTLSGGERLIGRSEPMRELRRMISKVARTNAPVWITGESGTGKELIARLIHENGPRAPLPFVAINCGAIPAELMESELFGHRKGSFSGAVSDSEGLFRRAEGGTLFLDEVAELPLHMQVKLLRAIQERSVRPVGGSEELTVDARILSASHADLAIEVDAGRFRHDLYYRLNVISIRSPSLRDRTEDIAELARHVLTRLTEGSHPARALCPEAIARLEEYHFPGNVRELENLLERALVMSETDLIGPRDLLDLERASSDPLDGPSAKDRVGAQTDDRERQRLVDALEAARWNRKAAASNVGLTYRQFRYRLAQLGIEGPGGR